MKSLVATIYIDKSSLVKEINRLLEQASQASINVRRTSENLKLQCEFDHYFFIVQFKDDGSLPEVILTPFQPLKLKKDELGNEELDLAFYIKLLLKIIAGYEMYSLITMDSDKE